MDADAKVKSHSKDAQHPWRSSPSSTFPGSPVFRVKCWQFEPARASEIVIRDLPDLHSMLTQRPGTRTHGRPSRRLLIILEGIHPRVAEPMGVHLDILPGFWLAHCDYCDSVTTNHSATHSRNSPSVYWKLDIPLYRQDPSALDNMPCSDAYTGRRLSPSRTGGSSTMRARGQVCRIVPTSRRMREAHVDFVFINPPAAILLLDTGNVPLKPESEQPGDLHPNPQVGHAGTRTPPEKFQGQASTSSLDCNSSDPGSGSRTSVSLFEELNGLMATIPLRTTGDPFSATTYTRNIICREWEFYESAYAQYLYDSLSTDSVEYRRFIQRDAAPAEINKGSHVTILTRYQTLVERKHEIAYAINSVRQAMWTFCRRRKDYHLRQYLRDHRRQRAKPTGIEGSGQGSGAVTFTDCDSHDDSGGSGSESSEFLESQMEAYDTETHRWGELRDNLEDLQKGACDWMNIFAQRASLEEALAANRQARSAGQLTKIATVAVPFGMVAAIFSMEGSFAAGGNDFYLLGHLFADRLGSAWMGVVPGHCQVGLGGWRL